MCENRYAPEDRIFPSPSDGDLWAEVDRIMRAEYPGRALPEHVRQAFEAVCAELDGYLPFRHFLRKVRLKWLWRRPPAPRGVLGLNTHPD